MKKLIKANLLCLLLTFIVVLCFIPNDAIAGVFDPPITDKSVEYLSMVFGGSIGGINLGASGDSTAFLGSLFQVFNGIVLAVAIFILSYTSALSVINTAHEGEIMGKKFSSVWIPLRSAMGLLLLAPVPGSGYSLLQVTVVWIVINGIGAADMIWDLVADNLAAGVSVTQNVSKGGIVPQLISNGTTLSKDLLRTLVCLEVLNKYADTFLLNSTGAPLGHSPIVQPITSGANPNISGKIIFGANDPTNTTRQDICGSVSIGASLNDNLANINLTTAQKQQLVTNAYQVKSEAIDAILTYVQPLARDIANLVPDSSGNIKLPDYSGGSDSGLLYSSILSYEKTLATLTKNEMVLNAGGSINPGTSLAVKLEDSKKYGWMLAGAYYYQFTTSGATQTLLSTATNDPPNKVTGQLLTGGPLSDLQTAAITKANLGTSALVGPSTTLGSILNQFSTALSDGAISGLFIPPQGNYQGDGLNMSGDRSIYALMIVNPIMMIPIIVLNEVSMTLMDQLFSPNTNDPLLTIASAGKTFMDAAEGMWIGIMAASFALTVVSSICAATNPIGYGILGAFISMLPMGLCIAGTLESLGATMSIYIPMVPYMIFAVTALGWFISVIEAVVAAPVVALGLIIPSQDELGKVTPALGMIATIFLRPMLTIIGLLLAAKLFKTTMIMINQGFRTSLASVVSETGRSMFAWIGMLMLYVGFCIALINKCYSLIHHLPDKILSWIGVSGEQTDTSAIKDAKGTMESGSEKAMSSIKGGAASAAGSMAGHTGEGSGGGGGGSPGGATGGGGGGGSAKPSGDDLSAATPAGGPPPGVGSPPPGVGGSPKDGGGSPPTGAPPSGAPPSGGGGAPPTPPPVPPV